MTDLYTEILQEVRRLPVIDTHEHLPHCDEARDQNTDILKEYLSHYMSSDILSSGMKASDFAQVIDVSKPIKERWKLVEPYWEVCRYTGYGRALDIAVKQIYGFDGINENTIEEVNQAFIRNLKPGHFKRVLKDICGIQMSLLDGFTGGLECDKSLFRRVWRPENYVVSMDCSGKIFYWLERKYGITLRTLDDWIEAFCREFEDALNKGIAALKCGLAYVRSLRFEKRSYSEASSAFKKMIDEWEKNGRKEEEDFSYPVEVQDFMMHFILGKANEKKLTFQFHTGLQEGNGNTLSNSNPLLMNNLFLEYPDVKFDLFHISYPFYGEASALCKNFPNVFIDMCWAHIISPAASRVALNDFLDAVPYNKISAFGGDYLFVDGICGHLELARQNVSHVLAHKVKEGIFTLEKAVDIAKALFYDNPLQIFDLNKVL